MPIEILSRAGRFLVMAVFSFSEASASAAPSIFTNTVAGLHSALALTEALQCALHSALISWRPGDLAGALEAFISTLHLPEQVPLHSPAAFISQLAEQEPLHVPLHCASTLPLHLPSQVPAHLPLLSLPSHLPAQSPSHLPEMSALQSPLHSPLHVPSQVAEASTVHLPSHLAPHSPLTSPPSQVTFASPGLILASHLAAQSHGRVHRRFALRRLDIEDDLALDLGLELANQLGGDVASGFRLLARAVFLRLQIVVFGAEILGQVATGRDDFAFDVSRDGLHVSTSSQRCFDFAFELTLEAKVRAHDRRSVSDVRGATARSSRHIWHGRHTARHFAAVDQERDARDEHRRHDFGRKASASFG